MVKIILSLKTVYAVVAVFISLVLIGVGVYAFSASIPSTSVPATMGHSMGELMPSCTGMLVGNGNVWDCIPSPSACTGAEQGLTWTGSAWFCQTLS